TADTAAPAADAGPTRRGQTITRPDIRPRHGTNWERRYLQGIILTDLASGLFAAIFAHQVRLDALAPDTGRYALLTLLLPTAWLVTAALHRGYDPRLLFVGAEE